MIIEILRPYILSFIVIFIAIDIFGNIPIFLSATEKFSHKQRKKITRESLIYAFLFIIAFIFIVRPILQLIGITISDFKIAVGLFLFVLSINLSLSKQVRLFGGGKHFHELGVIPIAMPIIASPAVLPISLIILDQFGILVIISALILNIFINWLILDKSEILIKVLGERGMRFISRTFEILLVAFAVMIFRQGIIETFFK